MLASFLRTIVLSRPAKNTACKLLAVYRVGFSNLCVPGMGMILWGVSPLYIIQEGEVLAEGKGGRVTDRLKEA